MCIARTIAERHSTPFHLIGPQTDGSVHALWMAILIRKSRYFKEQQMQIDMDPNRTTRRTLSRNHE